MSKTLLRKTLSAPGLLGLVRGRFERVNVPVGNPRISPADCLMSGLAVFGMKHSSLLKFKEGVRCDGAVRGNLRRLYPVRQVPADTTMRERLDRVDPSELRDAFKAVLSAPQRGKGPDGFAWLGGLGASRLPGGVRAAAGADPARGRGDEERLRAQRGEAPAARRAARAPAPQADGGGGRAGVERAAFKAVRKSCRTILTQAKGEIPPTPARVDGKRGRLAKSDAQNLHVALTKHEDEALRFARDPDVPFTNNRAERDIRMAKVRQKVSGCFRTLRHAQAYYRISSYLQSTAHQGYNPPRRNPDRPQRQRRQHDRVSANGNPVQSGAGGE